MPSGTSYPFLTLSRNQNVQFQYKTCLQLQALNQSPKLNYQTPLQLAPKLFLILSQEFNTQVNDNFISPTNFLHSSLLDQT